MIISKKTIILQEVLVVVQADTLGVNREVEVVGIRGISPIRLIKFCDLMFGKCNSVFTSRSV